ncbi:hypothetical protein [Cellulosimicrobium marinum]|uniref:hypothetical protein n=1 Tax=Cellulosimicrobium marinum TaxID=1638992 RepID=UPI001E538E55|nr:hypothetical protein [Cellulosimicrobium marinum]MCB7135679.1 hypothetical protein [Cellulosimicrobium marinum]
MTSSPYCAADEPAGATLARTRLLECVDAVDTALAGLAAADDLTWAGRARDVYAHALGAVRTAALGTRTRAQDTQPVLDRFVQAAQLHAREGA